ncbi:uncharacterized protein [Antedon mediterranea]|uniref:uncharacterized protein n=1 Tax=Antedon mediterranea TaxID=105859 RepID=UPI003AF5EF46
MAENEAAKRRDARRRKILQSSEERMKKIADVASVDDISHNDGDHENRVGKSEENTCLHNAIDNKSASRILKDIQGDGGGGVSETKDKNNPNSTDEVSENMTSKEQLSDEQSSNETPKNNEVVKWLATRNSLLAVGLGVLLRLILALNIAVINKQSVVSVFIISYTIWVIYSPWNELVRPSRPIPLPGLITTLLLAYVQNPTLAFISNIFNTVTEIVTNFALFLFTFVCTHYLLEVVVT